ncbi:MAG: ribosomal protein S12 methylthiotransferase RimO [Lentisphaerae bacterium GWF2_38_69]|nr:MAG: ribosomal protein S12 methylthiotransferase RimO [Lentisphaerae bacterium GWF2_38_69]
MKYIYIVSLGCSKNFVDTEIMAAELIQNGFGLTSEKSKANICLINTCAFIPPARTEAESNILECIKWKKSRNGFRKIIVTGCLTQWDKKNQYSSKYPEVDLWLGIEEIPSLPQKLLGLYDRNNGKSSSSKVTCNYSPKYLYDETTPRIILSSSSHAFIKIADGCDNRCSYCSIPSIRGNLRSRTIISVVKEAENIIKTGVREIILIAQDITAFSRDIKNSNENLAKLLKELDKIEGNYWIRLHYLHPEGITDELIETLKTSRHIIAYLDIPLQHISDPILKAMNRKIGKNYILEVLEKIRQIKAMTIRTTFLVGFPGETQENFEELLEFVRKSNFERIGVFPFYPEPGTKAAAMKNIVPSDVAKERAEIIQKVHTEKSLKFNSNLVGNIFDVILDSVNNKFAIGRTYMDSPDIDNTVIVEYSKKPNLKPGEIIRVKIESFSAFELKGILI